CGGPEMAPALPQSADTPRGSVADLLTAAPDDRAALRELKRLGFAEPEAALRNLHALTPTPREAEVLAPALPSLLAELSAAPDPDLALHNLERLGLQGAPVVLLPV